MTAPAWMPLYTGDYLRDTMHLSATEHGVYVLLFMAYWDRGGLPDDDAQLARIARLSLDQWHAMRPTIRALFGDGWTHKRIDSERMRTLSLLSARSAAGKRGASTRWDSKRKKSKRKTENNKAIAIAMARAGDCDSNGESESLGEDSTQQKEALARARIALTRIALNAEFDRDFWPAYPHKVGKPDARKAWPKARKAASVAEIVAGVDRYIRDKPPDRPWLNPSTFLNQQRWNDAPGAVNSGKGKKRGLTMPELALKLAREREQREREQGNGYADEDPHDDEAATEDLFTAAARDAGSGADSRVAHERSRANGGGAHVDAGQGARRNGTHAHDGPVIDAEPDDYRAR